MKKVKVIYVFAFGVLISLSLISCDKGGPLSQKSESPYVSAKGERFYGGSFDLNETEYVQSLFPPNIKDVVSARVAGIVFEGLLKLDQKTLRPVSGLAKKYLIDSTGTEYTFILNDSIYFHDDPCFKNGKGRLLKSEDIKFCFESILTKSDFNKSQNILLGLIKGSKSFYENSSSNPDQDLEGFKIIDDKTFSIVLENPSASFLQNLCLPELYIYPAEAFHKYGINMAHNPVGTGAFYLEKYDMDARFVFKKNPVYYGSDKYGNRLPFLNHITVHFIRDKKTELLEFKKENLEMIYRLPREYFVEILQGNYEDNGGEYSKYDIQQSPEMMTQFLGFNNQSKTFSNRDLRKAISFAIDRNQIIEQTLMGEAYAPGIHGITPPCFENYPIDQIQGFQFNADSAIYYYEKAGYSLRKPLLGAKLWLHSDGQRNTHVAVSISKQLKMTLGIDIDLEIVPLSVLQQKIIDGSAEFYRIGWLADIPSPENFLSVFHGKYLSKEVTYPNIVRYKNTTFDKLFEIALRTTNTDQAFDLFRQAERIMIKDSPLVVLWYEEGFRLLQKYVKNFPNNAMQYRNFNEVYFEVPETLEEVKL